MFTPEYSGTYYLQTVMTGKKGAFLSGDKSFTASSNIITIVVTNPAGNYTTQANTATKTANSYAEQASLASSAAQSAVAAMQH